ncbi:hypothetical protein PIB30_101793 [Stylosanthes scabra]|uniref:Transposase MuDR plant domain-containing protein n=1 Tax=Stylosanthes scabra TaxID=79078 RepID=A0ABU6QWW7_9FABA|nr:hypothetical protein [Stylosanthes scabra]
MDNVSGGGYFLALIHHNGKMKRRTREGVKFKFECPTNVFITERTSFIDLQSNIIRKLGLDAKKRVRNIYYREPVAVVSSGVKYDSFSVNTDEDLQVLFHYRQRYPEVRTTKLYVEIDDVGASSGGSNPPPPPIHVRPTHAPIPMRVPETERIVSPSFDVNLPQDDEDACDLGDNRSFGELAVAMAGTPQPPFPQICHASPDPHVEEPLRCNDYDEEPALIEGDSNDDGRTIPVARGKEEVLLALKNYSIHRGVEYRVMESDHEKYHGKYKAFGDGCNWLIRVTNRRKKGHWEVRRHNGPHRQRFRFNQPKAAEPQL